MLWVGLVWWLAAGIAQAADTPMTFTDPIHQARYEALLQDLRCLVCQNQSLADSHADLAQDLRNEVYRMVNAGQDEAAVLKFMVARYGDFVLYRPPVKSITWSLWFGPFILLGVVAVIWRRLQRRSAHSGARPLSEEERARLSSLVAPPPPESPSS
jgi:cytochrome c-type biogenesis protein CcmH